MRSAVLVHVGVCSVFFCVFSTGTVHLVIYNWVPSVLRNVTMLAHEKARVLWRLGPTSRFDDSVYDG